MKKLIPISILLLASPVALMVWSGKNGNNINPARTGKILNPSENLFIGS